MEHAVNKRFSNQVNNVCDEEIINSIIYTVEYDYLNANIECSAEMLACVQI